MRQLIQKLFLLFLIVSLVVVGYTNIFFRYIAPQYSYGYPAALVDKVKRLETIKEPKMILVGNSNLAFGIDSEMLEKNIGMPVVNMGLQAALGNSFHENMAKIAINKGDIVIVCHTDYSDSGRIEDCALAWTAIENNFELFEIINTTDRIQMLEAMPNYMCNATLLWLTHTGNRRREDIYSRLWFNIYGDNIYPRPKQEGTFGLGEANPPEINDTCVARLNDFETYVKGKGATLLIAAYPIATEKNKTNPQVFDDFENELQRKVNIPIISHFSDYFIEPKYFYNMDLHLNDEGVLIRTRLLINDLKKWMDIDTNVNHDI